MAISGQGWELHVVRSSEQARGALRRTIGQYQVYLDGRARTGLAGWTVEAGGPGDNGREGSGLRIEAGVYPLGVNLSASYRTIGFDADAASDSTLKPCLGVLETGARTFILIHPGWGFSASVGCVQPTGRLDDAGLDIDFADSRERVLGLLADLEQFTGKPLGGAHGSEIVGARLVIEGEPQGRTTLQRKDLPPSGEVPGAVGDGGWGQVGRISALD